jgi:DNA-directed RNA polymerase subunit RPC12/RpoP
MDIKCSVCGKKYELTNEDVDYNKAKDDKKYVYVCTLCQAKIFHDATEAHKYQKPL